MPGQVPPYLDFDAIDSDEARYLIDSYPLSFARPDLPRPKK
jgi:hypothetical protein